MLQKVLFLSLLLSLFVNSKGQLRISGKVVNSKNEALGGVSIKLIGTANGASTNIDGQYQLTIKASTTYEIEFSAIGYQSKQVSDIAPTTPAEQELNIVLEAKSSEMENVVVASKRSNTRLESTTSIIQFQKNTNTVASVISAETIKRSPDRNTGEVIKRVSGASIIEGKYLVIRGLADRYNQTMLTGVLMSSTEPDRKTFSYDIIPSGMVDNIIINKAFIPEMPGEWAGGIVQVNTKDVPTKNFFTIQLGTGFNSQTIGKDFYTYAGGKLDALGIDDGTRGLPKNFPVKTVFENLSAADKNEWGKQFTNTWSPQKKDGVLNSSFLMNGGFAKSIWKNSKIAGIAALTYNHVNKVTWANSRIVRFQNNTSDLYFDYDNNKYSQEILAGALANLTLQISTHSKISFKNIININGSNYVTMRTGKDFESRNGIVPDNIKATELALKTNTFYNSQLTGDHNLTGIGVKLHWYGSFNILDQYIPDQRRIQYIQEDPTVKTSPYVIFIPISNSSQKNGSRYFGFLNDYIYTAGGDIAKSFKLNNINQVVKGGYFFQVKDRLFDARPFTIYNPSGHSTFQYMDAGSVFSPEHFGNGNDGKLSFSELGPGENYRYVANSILNAAFIQFDNQLASKLRVVWGLRMENFDQVIGSMHKSDSRHVYTKVTDFLPGINVTYKLQAKTNIRFSASQTVVRPEFRELSKFQFYDFELNAIISGNSGLQRTKVSNLDFRYELYPKAGETFSIGLFYKKFRNPLEAYFNPASGDGSTFNLINASSASSYGIEVDFRKKLDVVDLFKNFTLQGNTSYIYNRVVDNIAHVDRPMQGQSPYLLNGGLNYDISAKSITTTLLFNRIGRRIVFVGGSDQPPIWENPRSLIDLQIAKKLMNNKAEFKINVSDILNKAAIFYYDVNENNKYDREDTYAIKRKYGTNVSVSLSYSL